MEKSLCEILGHDVGGVVATHKNGKHWAKCKRCKDDIELRPKTLAEKDGKKISELDNILHESHDVSFISPTRVLICKKCGGDLCRVIPERVIRKRTLCECSDCGEREYKNL